MPVNCDQTLIAILNQKHVFFMLMDLVQGDSQNPSMEFKISEYESALVHQTGRLDGVEKRRLHQALSIENLERNGLISYQDKRTGRFRLQDFVLEMLRYLESKRLRELSSAELNQLMKQLEECYRQVSDYKTLWLPNDPAFEEMVESVYHGLQHVASKLKSNIRALKGQSERLAQIVDEREFSDLEQTDQVRFALREILRIHERHVTPTLQFLDERLDIHRSNTALFGKSAPMALVTNIIKRFSEHNQTDHVTRLQRIHFHILLMGREVGEIAKGLDTYVKYAETERRRYNRTELLYNELKEAVQGKQTGQLKDFLLKPDNPIFLHVRPLGNIKTYSRSQTSNINWPQARGTQALNEIFRVRLENEAQKPKQPTRSTAPPVTKAEVLQRRIIEKLINSLKNFNSGRDYDDIYDSLHVHLSKFYEDYSLERVIDAEAFLSACGNVVAIQPEIMKTLEWNGYTLRYRQRMYSARQKSNAKEN